MTLLDIGAFTHELPNWLNILINLLLLSGAGYLGLRAYLSGEAAFAAGFALFAAGQLFYITHHAGLTALLFVHLLGDGTVFVSFVFIFLGLLQHGIIPRGVPPEGSQPAAAHTSGKGATERAP